MNRKSRSVVSPTLADMPFSKLLKVHRELAELRRKYECRPSEERRNAADWQYDSTCASDLFDQTLDHIGLGYCAGKGGRFDEAVKHTRRAVGLEPDNFYHLSDLGFSLTQAGQYDEAERILLRAITLAPPDYKMAKGNLDHLYKMRD